MSIRDRGNSPRITTHTRDDVKRTYLNPRAVAMWQGKLDRLEQFDDADGLRRIIASVRKQLAKSRPWISEAQEFRFRKAGV